MQLGFGAGVLSCTPLTDAFGNSIANPTPVHLGILQEGSVDFSFDVKELYGSSQFPIYVGRGKGKVSGKAKNALINGLTLNTLVFGQTLTSGQLGVYADSTGSVIPSTPFTVTPTVPGSGTWLKDLGVRYATGVPLTRVISGPTVGQYSVSAGAYTFAAADTGVRVLTNFQYSATATTPKRLTVANLPMGAAPQFTVDLMIQAPNIAGQLVLTLPACITTKFSLGTKLDDFLIPEFDFSAFADGSGNIAYMGTAE